LKVVIEIIEYRCLQLQDLLLTEEHFN
jgi:hypothetical protein